MFRRLWTRIEQTSSKPWFYSNNFFKAFQLWLFSTTRPLFPPSLRYHARGQSQNITQTKVVWVDCGWCKCFTNTDTKETHLTEYTSSHRPLCRLEQKNYISTVYRTNHILNSIDACTYVNYVFICGSIYLAKCSCVYSYSLYVMNTTFWTTHRETYNKNGEGETPRKRLDGEKTLVVSFLSAAMDAAPQLFLRSDRSVQHGLHAVWFPSNVDSNLESIVEKFFASHYRSGNVFQSFWFSPSKIHLAK